MQTEVINDTFLLVLILVILKGFGNIPKYQGGTP